MGWLLDHPDAPTFALRPAELPTAAGAANCGPANPVMALDDQLIFSVHNSIMPLISTETCSLSPRRIRR